MGLAYPGWRALSNLPKACHGGSCETGGKIFPSLPIPHILSSQGWASMPPKVTTGWPAWLTHVDMLKDKTGDSSQGLSPLSG